MEELGSAGSRVPLDAALAPAGAPAGEQLLRDTVLKFLLQVGAAAGVTFLAWASSPTWVAPGTAHSPPP